MEHPLKNMLLLMALVVPFGLLAAARPEKPAEAALVHNVFFTLKDKNPEARAKFLAVAKKYLAKTPDTIFFAVGPLAPEFTRDVNDRAFDVCLTLVFKNKTAHDAYQDSPAHQEFIKEARPGVEKVRVFDSYIDP